MSIWCQRLESLQAPPEGLGVYVDMLETPFCLTLIEKFAELSATSIQYYIYCRLLQYALAGATFEQYLKMAVVPERTFFCTY